MKKTALILLLVLLNVSLFAQFPHIGPKVGITSAQLSADIEDYNEESILGYQLGAFARFDIGKFYIQPEAYYTKKGGELNISEAINPFGEQNNIKLSTFDVPLMIGYKILDRRLANIRINAGPVASFVIDKEIEVTNPTTPDWKSGIAPSITIDDIKNANWGFQAGVGIDLLMFTIDVRAEWGISDISELSSLESKSNLYSISVGWKLF